MGTPPVFLVAPGSLPAGAGRVVLDGPEGRHAARVRRLAAGEPVDLVDGTGGRAAGVVAAVRGDRVEVAVEEVRREPAPQPRLTVVQALAKGDRAEAAVAALTEVGVDAILAWPARRCVVRWDGERAARGLARWAAAAREASKQARRAWVPEVRGPVGTAEVTDLLRRAALPVVLHEGAADGLADLAVPAAGEVVVVVGPEGGLAEDELAGFAAAGARTCRLGPTVLRTGTAGVVAAAVLLARSPRWAGRLGAGSAAGPRPVPRPVSGR